jgi:hypothetical protein
MQMSATPSICLLFRDAHREKKICALGSEVVDTWLQTPSTTPIPSCPLPVLSFNPAARFQDAHREEKSCVLGSGQHMAQATLWSPITFLLTSIYCLLLPVVFRDAHREEKICVLGSGVVKHPLEP